MEKPLVSDVYETFMDYHLRCLRAMANKDKFKDALEALKADLEALGLAEHIDWEEE